MDAAVQAPLAETKHLLLNPDYRGAFVRLAWHKWSGATSCRVHVSSLQLCCPRSRLFGHHDKNEQNGNPFRVEHDLARKPPNKGCHRTSGWGISLYKHVCSEMQQYSSTYKLLSCRSNGNTLLAKTHPFYMPFTHVQCKGLC